MQSAFDPQAFRQWMFATCFWCRCWEYRYRYLPRLSDDFAHKGRHRSYLHDDKLPSFPVDMLCLPDLEARDLFCKFCDAPVDGVWLACGSSGWRARPFAHHLVDPNRTGGSKGCKALASDAFVSELRLELELELELELVPFRYS